MDQRLDICKISQWKTIRRKYINVNLCGFSLDDAFLDMILKETRLYAYKKLLWFKEHYQEIEKLHLKCVEISVNHISNKYRIFNICKEL